MFRGCSSVGSGEFTQACVDGFDGVGCPFEGEAVDAGEVGEQHAVAGQSDQAAVCSPGAFVRVPPRAACGGRSLGVGDGVGALVQPRSEDGGVLLEQVAPLVAWSMVVMVSKRADRARRALPAGV